MQDYRFDPELAPFVPVLPTVTDFSALPAIELARSQMAEMIPTIVPLDEVVRTDVRIDGPDGPESLRVRVYRPEAAASTARPAVVEIHGGGFMMGSLEMMDPWCDQVAAEMDAVVVSVDYRLAPEHPYPAAVEDCYAALAWTAASADDLGIDRERIAISGQSAGGGLAAATTLMAHDRGGPELCFQLLEIPELDDRLTEPSMVAFTDTPLWNRPNAEWSWRHYLGPLHGGEVPDYAAPARRADLSGLPPTFVSVMEYDPLRDEGITYAQRLLQAGVSTELHAYPGTFHGASLVPGTAVARRLAHDSLGALARALAP